MKKAALIAGFLLASGSVQAQNQQILDDLVFTSGEIRSTMDYGIKIVGGQMSYANQGGISPDISYEAHISQAKADAYNNAVASFMNNDWTYTAQDYADDQAARTQQEMDAAIDAYVEASVAIATVVTVNEMADAAGDPNTGAGSQDAEAVQNYLGSNDTIIDEGERLAYNDAIDEVQGTAQAYAVAVAMQNDVELQNAITAGAESYGMQVADAGDFFFDAALGNATIGFGNAVGNIALDMAGYFKTKTDILTEGANSDFYQTGPTQNPCFFAQTQEEYDLCIAGQTGA